MKVAQATPLLFFAFLAACSNAAQDAGIHILNSDLYTSYKDYSSEIKKQRSELSFDTGQAATNCISYFELSFRHNIAESIHNQSVKSEYLVCDALEVLHKASTSPEKSGAGSDSGYSLVTRLDLRSFPSSLFMISDDAKHTLKSIYPDESSHKDAVAILDTADWTFRLEVVASAQLDNNPAPDWIVWLSDEGKSGNYRAYTTLIVYNPGDKGEYTAQVYPKRDR